MTLRLPGASLLVPRRPARFDIRGLPFGWPAPYDEAWMEEALRDHLINDGTILTWCGVDVRRFSCRHLVALVKMLHRRLP